MALTLAGVFTLEIETTTNDNISKWRNSIDIQIPIQTPIPQPGDAIVSAFETFMQFVQRDDCHLSRMFLRPWVRGAGAAGGSVADWDEPLDLPCANFGPGKAFPGSPDDGSPTLGEVICLMTKARSAGGGRKHHMSLRNVVWQALLLNSAGKGPILNPGNAATVSTDLTAWAQLNLGPFYTPGSGPRFVLVDASVKHNIAQAAKTIGSIAFQGLSMRDIRSSSRR